METCGLKELGVSINDKNRINLIVRLNLSHIFYVVSYLIQIPYMQVESVLFFILFFVI